VPGKVLIGEDFTFEVTFENTGNATGFGPYIELYLPAWGADGNAPAPSTSTPSLKCDGISYVDASALFTSPPNVLLAPTLPTPSPLTPCPPSAFVYPPSFGVAPLALAGTSTAIGHQLAVIEFPPGSFNPSQPKVTIKVTAHVSDYADVNVPVPLTIHARGGFRHGGSPTATAIVGSPDKAYTTPIVIKSSKQYLGPENEIAVGPNFIGQYEISEDIADGQSVANLQVNDDLPASMQYEGSLVVTINGSPPATGGSSATGVSCSTSGIDYTFTPPTPLVGGTLSVNFCNPITGTTADDDVTITFDFSIVQNGLNSNNCAPVNSINTLNYKGQWTPLDPRDQSTNPSDPSIPIQDSFIADHPPLYNKCMAIQKSVTMATDTGAPGYTPGDILKYTIQFQVSDYRMIGDLVATDFLADGQSLMLTPAPRITVSDKVGSITNSVLSFNQSPAPQGTCTVYNPETGEAEETITGGSRITFDISGTMVAFTPAQPFPFLKGILTGGWSGTQPASTTPATGTIVFYAKIDDVFQYNHHPDDGALNHIVKDDPLCNGVQITGNQYVWVNNKNGSQLVPSGANAMDNSGVGARIIGDTIKKTVYAVVRDGVSVCGPGASSACAIPPAIQEVRAGDVVTYRIEKEIPSSDADMLSIQDWLPLPIFSVADPTANGANTGMTFSAAQCNGFPASGNACFGPVNTLISNPPTFSTDPSTNSLTFDYGSFNDSSNASSKVDLLFSATVSTDPFADDLDLTNEALEHEENTFGFPFDQVAIAQVKLREPELSITKGVVAADNPHGVFTPSGSPAVSFTTPPGSACPKFTGTITSGSMINSDLSGVDAGDQVTFAIAVENSGGAPAYDIDLKDIFPLGPTDGPSCFKPDFDNICVTDGNGVAIPFSTFTAGQGAMGIHLLSPLSALPAGSNVAVISFNGTLLDKEQFMAGCCDNKAELTHYASIQTGQDFVQADIGGPFEDVAKVCSGPEPYGKCIQSTSEAHTTPLQTSQGGTVDAAIGEIVRYRLITTIPEGTTHNFQIKDLLPPGLTYAGNPSVTFVADNGPVTSPPASLPTLTGDETTYGQCPGTSKFPLSGLNVGGSPFVTGAGTDPIFFVGSPPVFAINNPDSDANLELAIIEFNAVVDNIIPPNVTPAVLPNQFEVSYQDAQGSTITSTSGSVNAKIVEPKLTITKAVQMPGAGNNPTYSLTVSNTGNTDAFDVVVSDALSNCLTGLSNVSVTPGSGVTNNSTASLLNIGIARIAAGAQLTVSYQANLGCASDQCPIVNNATVTWTSLPGPQGTVSNPTGSQTPGASGANNGERNGNGSAPNTYTASSASVDLCGEICVEKKESGGGLLAGWEVNIDTNPLTTITTNAAGSVCKQVIAGTYNIHEVVQGGWTPVSPPNGSTTQTVTPGGSANVTFENKKLPAEHYKCYDVDPDSFTPLTVTLKDQFGVSKPTLLKTKYLCTPVDKNGEGIVDPVRHQVCYEMKPTMSPNKLVEINNQFGTQMFTVKDERLLCVPSTKKVLKPGQVCGYKFNDLDGNGVWNQPQELGLQGWTINVTGANGQVIGTATTDASGKYCIPVPASFTPYSVTEDLQSQSGNWTQTAPTIPYSVQVGSGQTVNNINFGNKAKIPPSCCLKVNKVALNTPWQPGGQGVFTLEVQNTCSTPISYPANTLHVKDMLNSNFVPIYGMGNGWACTGSDCMYASAVTLAPGATLPDLITINVNVGSNATGNIQNCASAGIQLAGPPQWCPETCITIPVQKNQMGQICGYKFNDLDGNGVWNQPQEIGLSGWVINVTDASGAPVGSATTDASGHYCVPVPASSTPYSVTEDIQSQGGIWSPTAPTIPHSVSVASGQTVNNINFGNHQAIPTPCCVQVTKTALNTPWQAGGQGSFTLEVKNACNTTISSTKLFPELEVQDLLDSNFTFISATGSSWSCVGGSGGYPLQCGYSPFSLAPGGILPIITVNVGIGQNASGTIQNTATTNLTGPVLGPTLCSDTISVPIKHLRMAPPHITIEKKHSPSRFSTGGKGMFSIKVTNKGEMPTRGMLKVIDHMPAGLSVKTGKFVADLWTCEGGKITRSGQDVTCVFNKTLRKNRWSEIKLNTAIASNERFPARVNVVRNCATASVQQGAAGAFIEGPKVCDKVRIKHVDHKGGAMLPAVTGGGATIPHPASSPHVSIEKKHSPSRFSTGSRGAFKIIVKNRGAAMEKGALTVVDHMPAGLSVKTSTFRAGSWRCKGGMVSGSGQDVTCSYNRILNRRGRAALNLNVNIAPKSQFPADVKEVENCATASAQGAASVKACDRVRINRTRSSETIDLAPLGGLIMQMPHGGGRPVRKVPGAVP